MIKSYSTDEGEFWIENYLGRDLNESEHFKWCNDFIDTYFPDKLTDEELVMEKHYKSKFKYQIAIAKKRFCESTSRGRHIINEDYQWDFIFLGKGL